MTAQAPTYVNFQGTDFKLLGYDEATFEFDPKAYGLKPVRRSTACHSGFRCAYTLKEDGLYLTRLRLASGDYVEEYDEETKNTKRWFKPTENMPVIMGAKAKPCHSLIFNYKYDFDYNTNYNGRLLLGEDSDAKHYVHGGQQPTYSFAKVLGVEIAEGKIVSIVDLSEDAWYAKQAIEARRKATTDPVVRMVYRLSSDSYETDYQERVDSIKKWAAKGREYAAANRIEMKKKPRRKKNRK